ncbi:hypothetical protein DFH08DRAFT_941074 [Mycena albidolilacea]|uniref:Protein kinase domain-containing protein n=1 Tax=Mycena albidolilacea TaxID=1033008 RepID=A0AAD6ZL62_9AGAR|nr:hypothetical protein DFH08DRAFT_941074 [Mycena albidolilacea]
MLDYMQCELTIAGAKGNSGLKFFPLFFPANIPLGYDNLVPSGCKEEHTRGILDGQEAVTTLPRPPVVSQAAALSGGDGPALGVGNSFPIWKEGGGGVRRGSKKTFRPYVLISNPEFPLAGAIGLFNHPVITSKSRSTATRAESVSSAELALPVTNGRQLRVVSREDDWVEAVKGRYGFDTVLLPAEDESGGPYRDIRCLLTLNRTPEQYDEAQETDTHKFHGKIYEAARFLAAAYVDGGGLCDGDPFPPAARTAIATLQHRNSGCAEDSLIYPDHTLALKVIAARRWEDPSPSSGGVSKESILLVGEDKTCLVMSKLRHLVDDIVQKGSYEYPNSSQQVPAGVRVLTQVWSQMASFRLSGDPAAWINKLYASSTSGKEYHCYFKLVSEETVAMSRCIATPSVSWVERLKSGVDPINIFYFFGSKMFNLTQAFWGKPAFRSPSFYLEVDPARRSCLLVNAGRNTGQILFDEVAGVGATGTALRSRAEKKILKFGAPRDILHEALIYEKLALCKNLAIPRYWGLYPLRAEPLEQLAIILEDVGVPIETSAMTPQQRFDLAHLIRQLHELGVHHHDVFGNTLIDKDGIIRLVDFGMGEMVPPGGICHNCDDRDSLIVLELEN